jgi:hypothetical protein
MYDADNEASPKAKRSSELSVKTSCAVHRTTSSDRKVTLRQWEGRNKDLAKENADNRRLYDLRDAEQNEVGYVSSCHNLRAHAKLDQKLTGEALRERRREPLPKHVCHRFGQGDYYDRSHGPLSTNTMTVTNSMTGAKRLVRFDLYTLPGEPLANKEKQTTESEDASTQVANG